MHVVFFSVFYFSLIQDVEVNYKSKWRSRRRIHTAFLLKLYFNNSIMDRLTWIKSLINAILFYGALKMAMSKKMAI